KSIVLPALRAEARNLMDRSGKLCSMSTCRMISPTAPVAPTTAMLGTTNNAFQKEPDHEKHQATPTKTRLPAPAILGKSPLPRPIHIGIRLVLPHRLTRAVQFHNHTRVTGNHSVSIGQTADPNRAGQFRFPDDFSIGAVLNDLVRAANQHTAGGCHINGAK